MAWCLLQRYADKFKEALINGEINPSKLNEMSSQDRTKFLEQYVGEQAPEVNKRFERSLLLKNQNAAMIQWAKETAGINKATREKLLESIKQRKKDDFERIFNPKEEQTFLATLAEQKVGTTITRAESKRIFELSREVEKARDIVGDSLGDPSKLQENIDFFKARREMDNYLLSLLPSNNLKVLTGTIGRGAMLASVKSPILNIGSNIEIGLTEAFTRRASTLSYKGTDNAAILDYVKFAQKVYQETGYDVSRMRDLGDYDNVGGRVLDKTVNTQGPGQIRATARVVEDIVFKQLMGAPDVAFASAHFADSLNINALRTTKGDVAEAKKIMTDAMRIQPQTEVGKVLREQAILDAEVATWTDKSWASSVSLGVRGLLNKMSGDLRLGDYLMPFVKTPANVISTAADYGGLGAAKALVKTVDSMRRGDFGSEAHVRSISRDLVRSGLGLLGALVITMNLDDDDFVGAYDSSRYQYEELRGSNYNAIRVGGKWISVDWLGPLSISVSAMMYARKYGSTPQEQAFQYGRGVISTFQKLPGVSDVYDFVKENQYKKDQSLNEAISDTGDYVLGELYSRLVPSLIGDIARATDKYERETGGNAMSIIRSRIPGARQTLPIREDVFARDIETQSPISTILFGQRIKRDRSNPVIDEIGRVAEENNVSISFTDWDRTSSKKIGQFRSLLSEDEFGEAKKLYGSTLEQTIAQLIELPEYKEMSNDEQLEILRGIDTDVMNWVFDKYGFEYVKVD